MTKVRRIEQACKEAGYKIPKNGLRHSFGSHHLIHYDNPFNTATEMGHIGPHQTFKAYRKAVLKSRAAEFFAIRCEAKPYVSSPYCMEEKERTLDGRFSRKAA